MPTFAIGDHIRVKRLLYAHHGIFLDDSRVIDFSGGRNIWEKPDALVQARTLKEFEESSGPEVDAIEAYKAFDRRESGWVKVELKPQAQRKAA